MWVGLAREGFPEEGSQDAGVGDAGACGSRTHTVALSPQGFPLEERSR